MWPTTPTEPEWLRQRVEGVGVNCLTDRLSKPLQVVHIPPHLQAALSSARASTALRISAQCWNSETQRHLPALVGMASFLNAPRQIVGVHLTWLPPSSLSAELLRPTELVGRAEGGGVVFGAPSETLIVGQSVESTLGACRCFDGPAIATLSTAGMRALDVPPHCSAVRIIFDHDREGEGAAAAEALALRLRRAGKVVQVYPPPKGFADWNDWARFDFAEAS